MALMALGLKHAQDIPGGSIMAFWEPATTTSMSPFVGGDVVDHERADRVHHQNGVKVLGYPGQFLDGMIHAGGGFQSLHVHGLDGRVFLELRLHLLGFYRVSPGHIYIYRHAAVGFHYFGPALAEFAASDGDGLVAGGEQVRH